MPINVHGGTAIDNPAATTTSDATAFDNMSFNDVFRMPTFWDWIMRMLEGMGYGVFAPGETPTQTSNTGVSERAHPGLDPFGADWSEGMIPPTPPNNPAGANWITYKHKQKPKDPWSVGGAWGDNGGGGFAGS